MADPIAALREGLRDRYVSGVAAWPRAAPVLLILLAACAGRGTGSGAGAGAGAEPGPTPPAPSALAGRTWVLEDLAGAGVIDDAQATLQIGHDGRVSGSGSCNRFSGSATITGDSIAFSPLATTLMACAEAVLNQERNYLAALAQAKQYEVQGSTLFLHLGGGSEPLRFTAR